MKISFKCPKCLGNKLLLAESTINWYSDLVIERDFSGGLKIISFENFDEVRGTELGYRCMDCQYPDEENLNACLWTTLLDLEKKGALLEEPFPGKEHHGMACSEDGTLIPIRVLTSYEGPLKTRERLSTLEWMREQKNLPFVFLLTEEDRGILPFVVEDWDRMWRCDLRQKTSSQKS